MPQCSDYGQGWVGEYPDCRYQSATHTYGGGDQSPFTGTVGSLGFQDLLPEGSDWSDWSGYFDPYDPEREWMSVRQAQTDIGQLEETWGQKEEQLEEAWGLKGTQLGETLTLGREQQGQTWRGQSTELGGQWGAQQQQLGAGARRGFQDVERMISGMTQRGRGLKFGEQRQRQAEEEVSGAYKSSFGAGQSAYQRAMGAGRSRYKQGLAAGTSAYEQAMGTGQMALEQALETGQLGLQQGRTDIYQGLESDIFGYQQSWEDRQRDTLNMLLTSGIFDDDGALSPWTGEREGGIERCPPGQYMPLPESGLSGCQPIGGGYTPTTPLGPTQEPGYTGMGEEDICISKGGYWTGSSCEYE